jgi:hypothetical protein
MRPRYAVGSCSSSLGRQARSRYIIWNEGSLSDRTRVSAWRRYLNPPLAAIRHVGSRTVVTAGRRRQQCAKRTLRSCRKADIWPARSTTAFDPKQTLTPNPNAVVVKFTMNLDRSQRASVRTGCAIPTISRAGRRRSSRYSRYGLSTSSIHFMNARTRRDRLLRWATTRDTSSARRRKSGMSSTSAPLSKYRPIPKSGA